MINTFWFRSIDHRWRRACLRVCRRWRRVSAPRWCSCAWPLRIFFRELMGFKPRSRGAGGRRLCLGPGEPAAGKGVRAEVEERDDDPVEEILDHVARIPSI